MIGRMLYKQVEKNAAKVMGESDEIMVILQAMLGDMPLRQLGMMTQGALTPKVLK